jgi:hypothetical protein
MRAVKPAALRAARRRCSARAMARPGRRLLPVLALLAAGCPRAVEPCAPWVGWGLADMAVVEGQRLEVCTATELRYRVIVGGTVPAFLGELGRRPYAGWVLWRRQALLREGQPGVAVEPWLVGEDMLVRLRVDPSIDVDAGLGELQKRP